MRQIPLKYLPHTLEVSLIDESADYEGEYLEPFTIEHVRFERVEALNETDYKLADGAKGRIWIDAINSSGACDLPVGAKVVIDNQNMRVLTATPYFVSKDIHHWEVDVG